MKDLVAALARWVLKKEPVLTAAAVTGVLVGVLVHFGVHPSQANRDLITTVIGVVLPVLFGFVARAAAWSPASHHDALQVKDMAARPGGALPTDPA